MNIQVRHAAPDEIETAYAIVCEYYGAVGVQVRDDPGVFAREYFGTGAGVWMAEDNNEVIGCIALRRLPQFANSGEVKRLYVREEHRGQGIAETLLEALERYAVACGYETLYLDSKDDLRVALRFYRQHGYELCERYNDNPQATVFMRKHIR